jgi:excisionase family DNA binding protein
MEKICIVKRRKKDVELVFSGFDGVEPQSVREEGQTPAYTVTDVCFGTDKGMTSGAADFVGERRFSVELTPAQATSFQSVDWLTRLGGAKRERAGFDVVKEKGKIVFNFNFKTVPPVALLSGKDVCRMLAVSSSFLKNLVRSEEIRSYKIGRLRRFSLDDILGYLCEAARACGPHKEEGL